MDGPYAQCLSAGCPLEEELPIALKITLKELSWTFIGMTSISLLFLTATVFDALSDQPITYIWQFSHSHEMLNLQWNQSYGWITNLHWNLPCKTTKTDYIVTIKNLSLARHAAKATALPCDLDQVTKGRENRQLMGKFCSHCYLDDSTCSCNLVRLRYCRGSHLKK